MNDFLKIIQELVETAQDNVELQDDCAASFILGQMYAMCIYELQKRENDDPEEESDTDLEQ